MGDEDTLYVRLSRWRDAKKTRDEAKTSLTRAENRASECDTKFKNAAIDVGRRLQMKPNSPPKFFRMRDGAVIKVDSPQSHNSPNDVDVTLLFVEEPSDRR